MTRIPSARELLEFDIDLRLFQLWSELLKVEDFSIETMGPFVRAAYGLGYMDALNESEDIRGELCSKHGYRIPGQVS